MIQVGVFLDSLPVSADTTHQGNIANTCAQLNPMARFFDLWVKLSGMLPVTVQVTTVTRITTSNACGAFLLRHLLAFKHHVYWASPSLKAMVSSPSPCREETETGTGEDVSERLQSHPRKDSASTPQPGPPTRPLTTVTQNHHGGRHTDSQRSENKPFSSDLSLGLTPQLMRSHLNSQKQTTHASLIFHNRVSREKILEQSAGTFSGKESYSHLPDSPMIKKLFRDGSLSKAAPLDGLNTVLPQEAKGQPRRLSEAQSFHDMLSSCLSKVFPLFP